MDERVLAVGDGSNEAAPKDNDGGGLGNWHDMNSCCNGGNSIYLR